MKENNTIQEKKAIVNEDNILKKEKDITNPTEKRRIIDLLDIQLLLAVIIFFVSV